VISQIKSKSVVFGTAFALSFALSLASASLNAETKMLYAGQNQLVGMVNTTYSGGNLVVDFQMTESGWCLGKTHLYVGEEAPKKSAPGSFPYSHENLGCAQSDSFVVPTNSCAYVAAHAEVHEWTVPFGSTADYSVARPLAKSYLQGMVTVDSATTSHPAWCVDLEHLIYLGRQYRNCTISSSLDFNAPVDKPEHLDSVNYVIYMADTFEGAGKNELQAAIWTLIDDITPQNRIGSMTWNQTIVDNIVAEALNYGEGFVTPFDGEMAVVMYCGPSVQVNIFQVSMDGAYVGEETAWAAGDNAFTSKNGKTTSWGSYFQVCP